MPVASLAGCHPIGNPRETLAGAPRFFQRVRPRTLHLHDLSPMHEAPAGKADHLWLLLAPSRQGRRPLAGAAKLVHLLAILDRGAIKQTGDYGRKLSGTDRHHDLVEQPEPGLDLPLRRQDSALVVAGEGDQVRVAEALADLDSFDGRGVRRLVVAGLLLLHHGRHQ